MDARDRALIETWRDVTPGLLLDAGCGPGHWTDLLGHGGREVRGVDLSQQFIASARSRHPHLTFDVGSFRDLPLDDSSAGGILAWYSLIHTPPLDTPAVLAEFARVLVPGGSILIGFFEGEPREPFAHAVAPAWFWSPEALAELLADAGFAVDAIHRRGREVGEISVRPHADITATLVSVLDL
ncbi:class I SAM-dependent methyltransferase [Microbacterium sp. SD291]|nr:class I SAM-dependent methyltransferase [Microbacterium sp. SD291]